MLRNPNISENLGKLPAFSTSKVDAILADANESISASLTNLGVVLSNKAIPFADKSTAIVKDTCDSMITAGFGTGIAIASGVPATNAELQKLDKSMQDAINYERSTRARVLGIKVIDKMTNTVDPRADIPNWAKTVGATLPSWSDASSKEKLVIMILDQIKKNLKDIQLFRNAQGITPPEQLATICSELFQTEFLLGVVEGLLFAAPADFKKVKTSDLTKSGEPMDAVVFFDRIKAAMASNDISGLVAAALLRK